MPATPDSSPSRRNFLGWSSLAGIAAVATWFGWNRSHPHPQPHAAAPAVAPRPSVPSHPAEPLAEPAPQPVTTDTVFRRDAFLPHLSTDFTIIHEGDDSAECRLIDVSAERRITSPKAAYVSFTLLFAASPSFLREGGTCRVRHKDMAEMQIFLSPVGKPGGRETLLEAVFTQAV